MKKIFLIFLSIIVKGQQVSVVDSLDNKPIPFARIFDNKNVYLTDSSGRYNFERILSEQVLVLSSGYETKKLKITNEIIRLSPKIIDIDKVVITNKNFFIRREIGFIKSKNSIVLDHKREFAIELNNLTDENCRLENLVIPFKKSSNNKGYLLIDFYESLEGNVGQKINTQNYVFPISSFAQNNNVVLKENIYMEKQSSIFISMTWVENTYHKSESFANKLYFYTKQSHSNGKMLVRKSNYNGWDLKPYVEDRSVKSSIIPAFKVLSKCSN